MDTQSHPSHHRTAHVLRWVPCALLFLAGFLLLTEHRGHLLGFLPYVLFAICPLMHLYLHRRHGQHHDTDTASRNPADSSSQKPH